VIGTSPISHLAKQAIFGSSILGCCCKPVDEVVTGGGAQFPDESQDLPVVNENPLVAFQPIPPTPTPGIELVPNVTEKQVSLRRVSNYDILPSEGMVSRLRRVPVGPKVPGIDFALREAFHNFMIWEEDEFLALILASDDDECCYCVCPD